MRIGLLGGTFDPIHCGHLDMARAALSALDLDQIWVMPACQPPHRRHAVASAAHRFAMAALAIDGESRMLLSDLEMEQTGPSYTIQTLDRLDQRGDTTRHSFLFLIGADAFRDIRSWRAYPEILKRCHFAVMSRPGSPVSALREQLAELAPNMIDASGSWPATPSILLIDAATAPVSSTDLRRAIGEQRSLAGLIPDRVQAYIAKHRLYELPGEEPKG